MKQLELDLQSTEQESEESSDCSLNYCGYGFSLFNCGNYATDRFYYTQLPTEYAVKNSKR